MWVKAHETLMTRPAHYPGRGNLRSGVFNYLATLSVILSFSFFPGFLRLEKTENTCHDDCGWIAVLLVIG